MGKHEVAMEPSGQGIGSTLIVIDLDGIGTSDPGSLINHPRRIPAAVRRIIQRWGMTPRRSLLDCWQTPQHVPATHFQTLEESHARVETWPERGHANLETQICNFSRNNRRAAEAIALDLIALFQPTKIQVMVIQRGPGHPQRVLSRKLRPPSPALIRQMEGTLDPDAVATGLQEIAEDTPDALPTEMTVGGRTYEILSFLWEDEKSVPGPTMVARVKEMSANLGKDDGQFLLDNQQNIPVAWRGKVVFVFMDWRSPAYPGRVACVCCGGDRWVRDWYWLDDFNGFARVLRRKPAHQSKA